MNEQVESKLLQQIESVASSLEKIALLRAVEAFYSSEERAALLKKFRALLEADKVAYAAMRKIQDADPDDRLGWEASVERFGEEETRKRKAPFLAAFEAKQASSKQASAFEDEHPLIKQLYYLYPFASK
jgi:hypothetical protein